MPEPPDLVAWLASLATRPGRRLVIVGIDGWSGSGKTALADDLAAATGAAVAHVDDLVEGWDGLAASVDRLVGEVLVPLDAGAVATWASWDWSADRPGTRKLTVEPAPLVLVEGCGAGAAPARPLLDGLIWLEVPPDERRRRLEARADWAAYRPWWQRWADQEAALRAADDPRPHADVVVSWPEDATPASSWMSAGG